MKFKAAQESARKDIERAFGVLKAHWAIVNNPARAWRPQKNRMVMYACVILHNMILKDEGHATCPFPIIRSSTESRKGFSRSIHK